MGTIASRVSRRAAWTLAVLGFLGGGIFAWPKSGRSQATPADHAKHAVTKASGGDAALADELRQLREKVAGLEAALSRGTRPDAVAPMGGQAMGMGMGMMPGRSGAADGVRVAARYQDCLRCHQVRPGGPLPASHLESTGGMGRSTMGGMGMMGEMGMGAMSPGGMGGRPGPMMDDGMMGMGSMGRAKGMSMGHMAMDSTLPGFPGASHLYHIGSEGFFLDHDAHITLTPGQRKELNRIKEKALLGGSSCGRKIEEAEQELWELTASDTPDARAIEEKVREVEKLRGDQRLAFIRAVGDAAKVLTDEQRKALVGAAAPEMDQQKPKRE